MTTRQCGLCGASFEQSSIGRPRKYCGPVCSEVKRKAHNRAAGRQRYADTGFRSAVSFPNCIVCSDVFCSRRSFRGDWDCVHICPQCRPEHRREAHNRRMRNAMHTRRARVKGAFVERVDPRKVFEADGYRCHLCGKKTDPKKFGRHPKAPTVDHVIPLSRGGTHEPLNCRTACYRCNTLKGNRGGGEQLLLIS